mgnify:CR=1 FL=1
MGSSNDELVISWKETTCIYHKLGHADDYLLVIGWKETTFTYRKLGHADYLSYLFCSQIKQVILCICWHPFSIPVQVFHDEVDLSLWSLPRRVWNFQSCCSTQFKSILFSGEETNNARWCYCAWCQANNLDFMFSFSTVRTTDSSYYW